MIEGEDTQELHRSNCFVPFLLPPAHLTYLKLTLVVTRHFCKNQIQQKWTLFGTIISLISSRVKLPLCQ